MLTRRCPTHVSRRPRRGSRAQPAKGRHTKAGCALVDPASSTSHSEQTNCGQTRQRQTRRFRYGEPDVVDCRAAFDGIEGNSDLGDAKGVDLQVDYVSLDRTWIRDRVRICRDQVAHRVKGLKIHCIRTWISQRVGTVAAEVVQVQTNGRDRLRKVDNVVSRVANLIGQAEFAAGAVSSAAVTGWHVVAQVGLERKPRRTDFGQHGYVLNAGRVLSCEGYRDALTPNGRNRRAFGARYVARAKSFKCDCGLGGCCCDESHEDDDDRALQIRHHLAFYRCAVFVSL